MSKMKPEMVIINGWAMPAGVWGELRAWLELHFTVTWFDLDSNKSLAGWCQTLIANTPSSAVWLGWSLGGELVMEVARVAPEKVKQLLLLTTTPCFLKKPGWDCGQDEVALNNLRLLVSKGSASLIKRFALLQTVGSVGERSDSRAMLQLMDEGEAVYGKEVLQSGLNLLAQIDQRQWLTEASIPVNFILGEVDTVVVVKTENLKAINPALSVTVIPGMGHFPFLASCAAVGECLSRILDLPAIGIERGAQS